MPRPKKAIDMGFRCPGDLASRLRTQAALEQRSQASLVRYIIAQYYREKPPTQLELDL